MSTLFSEIEESEKRINLFIYCDEIKQNVNSLGERWMYLGILIVPENKKEHARQKLLHARVEADYYDELHFTNMSNYSYANVYNEKTLLAKKWIELLKRDANDKAFYWNIMGINCSNLNFQLFGNDKKTLFQNVYNRFFRTLLKNSFNNFFPGYKITVKNIFHDNETQLNRHHYFNWHSIYSLNNAMENVCFEIANIIFIDSDHHKEQSHKSESHFIQMIDLILGSFHQAFDNSSRKDGKVELGKCFGELVSTMMDKPMDIKNKFGYFRKYSFSFFPSTKIKTTEVLNSWERISSTFYNNRIMAGICNDQISLFQE